jgi:hypothetical protein
LIQIRNCNGCLLPDADIPTRTVLRGNVVAVLCRLYFSNLMAPGLPYHHPGCRKALEQHLKQYSETVIAVTHDRYFALYRLVRADRGEGIPWKGNYSSWLKPPEWHLRKKVASKT